MYKDLKPYTELNVTGKTVAIVANLDVPIKDGELLDNTKVKAIIPTIQYFQKKNNKILLISSLGQQTGEYDDNNSMMPVRFEISRELEKPVKFVSIANSMNSIKFMELGDILVFENLNFHPEFFSKNKDERLKFISDVKGFVDFVIYDAAGLDENLAHTNELLTDKEVYMGEAVINELKAVEKVKEITSHKPVTVIIGGKLNDNKIEFLKFITEKADKLLLGGSAAYDFMKFKGIKTGDSQLSDHDYSKKIEQIYKIATKNNCEIILPVDHILLDKNGKYSDIDTQSLKNSEKAVDIGPKTLVAYREIIESSQSIIWNGPVGVFENEESNRGTESIGEYIALSAPKNAFKLIFGDSTSIALKQLKVRHKRFSHISVAGDAFANYLLG